MMGGVGRPGTGCRNGAPVRVAAKRPVKKSSPMGRVEGLRESSLDHRDPETSEGAQSGRHPDSLLRYQASYDVTALLSHDLLGCTKLDQGL